MTDMDLDATLTGLQHPEDEPEWARMNTQEKTVAIKISEMCRLAQQEIERLKAAVLAERESCAVLLESEANRIKHTSHRDGLGMGHQAIEQALVYQAAAIRNQKP